jgi:uncharacterized protein (TIRG00374 family)
MKLLKNSIRVFISAGLISYLVIQADLDKILEVISHIGAGSGTPYFLGALLVSLITVYLMSIRWRIIMQAYQAKISTHQLFGFYLIGLFFNNFLPTSIGGDVVRVYRVSSHTRTKTNAIASIVIERMMGIAATLMMVIIALFFISQYYNSQKMLIIALVLFVSIAVFFFILIRNRPFQFLVKIFERVTIFNVGEKLNKLFEAIHYFRGRRRILLYVFLMSLVSQSTVVAMNYLLSKALMIEVSFSYLFVVVPVSFILTMLPSINGVGVRELGYVKLLGNVGVADAAAISLSFMNLIVPMLISISGAFLFVIQKKREQKEETNVISEQV